MTGMAFSAVLKQEARARKWRAYKTPINYSHALETKEAKLKAEIPTPLQPDPDYLQPDLNASWCLHNSLEPSS